MKQISIIQNNQHHSNCKKATFENPQVGIILIQMEFELDLKKTKNYFQEKHLEEDLKKTPFQKALEERAKRLEQVWKTFS